MHADRTVTPVRGRDEPQLAVSLRLRKRLLFVPGLMALFIRHDPNLQEVHEFGFRRIELTVLHAGTSRHALNVSGTNDGTCSHIVLVGELPFEHIRQDFHVAVPMSAEAAPRLDAVFIDHAKRAIPHVTLVVIVPERKSVKRPQPTMVGKTPFLSATDLHAARIRRLLAFATQGRGRQPFSGSPSPLHTVGRGVKE